MSDRKFEIILAIIFASIPGLVGVWGIGAGIYYERIGPAVVGLLFIVLAVFSYRILYKVLNGKFPGDEN